MTAHDSLLRAVCERPFDDGPRGIIADWYDDNGQPERAEFIRVQIANPESTAFSIADTPEFGPLGINLPAKDVVYRRGFPSAVSLNLRQLLGGECPVCTRESLSDTLNELGRQIGRRLPCPRCSGSGRSPGLAPALAKWPITSVTIIDLPPLQVNHGSFGVPIWGEYRFAIPQYALDASEGLRKLIFAEFTTRESALTTLSRAFVDLIRFQATPPLPGIRWERPGPRLDHASDASNYAAMTMGLQQFSRR